MTKKLQELLELATSNEDQDANASNLESMVIDVVAGDVYSNLEKIENSLPMVKGLEASDNEMDELAGLATQSYKDLIDLGMQVESRFSAEIFNVAGTMLNHAITAKSAKINKKLKMIELQLKKAALDHKISTKETELESTPAGEGHLLDRNQLLRAIANNKKNDK